MTDIATTTEAPDTAARGYRLMAGAFTALRIFTGLVWLTNALAKVFDKAQYDFGLGSWADHEVVELTAVVGATLTLNRYATALALPTAPEALERLAQEGLL